MWEGFKPTRYIFKNNAAPFSKQDTLSYVYDDVACHRVVASSFRSFISSPPNASAVLRLRQSICFALELGTLIFLLQGPAAISRVGDVPGPGVGRSIQYQGFWRDKRKGSRVRNRQIATSSNLVCAGRLKYKPLSSPSVDCCLISTSPPSSPHQSRATTKTTFHRQSPIAKAGLRNHEFFWTNTESPKCLRLGAGSYPCANSACGCCLCFHLLVPAKIEAPLLCSKNLLGHSS
jgi:hypothetical protein